MPPKPPSPPAYDPTDFVAGPWPYHRRNGAFFMVPLTQEDLAFLVHTLNLAYDVLDPHAEALLGMLSALEALRQPHNTFKAQALFNADPAKARQTLAKRGKDPNV